MAGAGIVLAVDDGGLIGAFGRLRALGADLRPTLDDIGKQMVVETQRNFERQQTPTGQRWRPSQRVLASGRGKTLQLSGRLMASITHRVIDSAVEWGTNVLYAAIHQFGGTIQRAARKQTIYQRQDKRTGELLPRFVKRRRSNFARDVNVAAHSITIPARPYLGVTPQTMAIVQGIITRDIAQAAGGAA